MTMRRRDRSHSGHIGGKFPFLAVAAAVAVSLEVDVDVLANLILDEPLQVRLNDFVKLRSKQIGESQTSACHAVIVRG